MAEENWGDDAAAGAVVAEIPEIKLFNKWSADDVQIADISLQVSSENVFLSENGKSGT